MTPKQWLQINGSYFLQGRHHGIMMMYGFLSELNRDYSFEKITCPTLVIHAFDDPMPPFEKAKQIAANIPGSEFMPIASGGHLLIGFQDKVSKKISQFIKEHNATNVIQEQISKEPERRNTKLSEPPTFFY